ncbi:hypothetical protein ABB37_09433 [Leptomonas pyrrhocoris]|uniref:Uncharacterized protein n=1 Tax=Leptomonas pyrrhocoris TaxID=157538 RepID=A0A0M9FQS1_LEPPY|nr:hypothetical protein ABB37_09433 [Leptomonas pyrrhocoris]KPA74170.1 hypothetical protein ABB37_09433 [Leptomonas pyrrhocoris]|eukprot:XP_015652609.1 hypothetical protein ABB37_09433 [Leptomonas pyrrhocoris]
MEGAFASVEEGVLAALHQVEELRCAIARQQAELERSRGVLRERLDALTASGDAAHATPSELQPTTSIASATVFQAAARKNTNAADADHIGGESMGGCAESNVDSPQEGLRPSQVTPAQPSSLVLSIPNAPSLSPTDFRPQEQAIRTRCLQRQQQRLLHAAKLQFAQEWKRLALPWFARVVQHEFFVPLMEKLNLLERRLHRLCVRMSPDLPQYTLRRQGAKETEIDDATFTPSRSTFCVPVLWRWYLDTATQTSPQARSSLSAESRSSEGEDVPTPVACCSSAMSAEAAEGGRTIPCANVMRERPPAADAVINEEAVIVPSAARDASVWRSMLLRTRRSLRHVLYVVRYGLLGGEERTAATVSPCPPQKKDGCECLYKESVHEPCLSCQVRRLLQRHAMWTSYPHTEPTGPEKATCFPFSEYADCGSRNSGCVSSTALSLLEFLQHLCSLHETLRLEPGTDYLRHQPGPAATQGTDVKAADVRGACDSPACTAPNDLAASLSKGSLVSLEQHLLLPFHVLDPVLNTLLDGRNAAPSCALPTRKLIGAILPLVQWWQSPSSCDCRCVYARAIRLARLYHAFARRAHLDATPNTVADSFSPPRLPSLTADAQLCELRRAEVHVREQWQELHTKLLIARSANSL